MCSADPRPPHYHQVGWTGYFSCAEPCTAPPSGLGTICPILLVDDVVGDHQEEHAGSHQGEAEDQYLLSENLLQRGWGSNNKSLNYP